MADDVILPGAAEVVATDEVNMGGGLAHVQLMKLVSATDGGTERVAASTARGLHVDPRPLVVTLSDTSAGLTTATTAYVLSDQLGTELEFASAVRATGGTGIITSAVLLDKANIVAGIDVFLFNATVTPASDNAANSFSDTDMAKCVGVLSLSGSFNSALNRIVMASNVPVPFSCAATSLFAHMVTRSDHTFFGAVGDLVLTLQIEQD